MEFLNCGDVVDDYLLENCSQRFRVAKRYGGAPLLNKKMDATFNFVASSVGLEKLCY